MKKKPSSWRIEVIKIIFITAFLIVAARLFYWQILKRDQLVDLAKTQYFSQKEILPQRGNILATDNFPLATNKKTYLLYALPKNIKLTKKEVCQLLSPLLLEEVKETTQGAKKDDEQRKEKEESLEKKLEPDNLMWVNLATRISPEVKEKIEKLGMEGLGFEEEYIRAYPEASMAAQLLGFVGKNEMGKDTGYFGLEGFWDIGLRGRQGLVTQETDPANEPIIIGSFFSKEKKDGQDLVAHLDRSVQFIVEKKLEEAVQRLKAKSGSVAVMDPETGGIMAMASYPSFDPRNYFDFDKSLFKNSVISETYEPGSTFKIFVMAAALDKKAIKPDTKCDICSKPLKIDKYEIKTWNDQYYPESSMDEVIQHSDNIGMVFVARKLGLDSLWQYLDDFGFGKETQIDLQGEIPSFLKPKKKWNEVDLATVAFGQGIAVTGIQMLRAAAAIANEGKLLEPHVVDRIVAENQTIKIEPKVLRQVIKPKTAKIITDMMVNAVEKGETKNLKISGYRIAGKTGTAQIPVAGHYDKEKTVASFIGFAPANKAKFVMLVKLTEPEASPWGSETAAPLFFSIAKELLVYYGVQPQ